MAVLPWNERPLKSARRKQRCGGPVHSWRGHARARLAEAVFMAIVGCEGALKAPTDAGKSPNRDAGASSNGSGLPAEKPLPALNEAEAAQLCLYVQSVAL